MLSSDQKTELTFERLAIRFSACRTDVVIGSAAGECMEQPNYDQSVSDVQRNERKMADGEQNFTSPQQRTRRVNDASRRGRRLSMLFSCETGNGEDELSPFAVDLHETESMARSASAICVVHLCIHSRACRRIAEQGRPPGLPHHRSDTGRRSGISPVLYRSPCECSRITQQPNKRAMLWIQRSH